MSLVLMALYSAASFFLTWLVEWQFFGSGSLVYLLETDYTQHDYISAGCTAPLVARIMVTRSPLERQHYESSSIIFQFPL